MYSQRSSDGSLSLEEESGSGFGRVGELQEVVDRQTADLGQMKERMASMVSRINELEEDLDTARKDLIKSEDMNTRLQRDLREVRGKRLFGTPSYFDEHRLTLLNEIDRQQHESVL